MANCPNCDKSGFLVSLYKSEKCGSLCCGDCQKRVIGGIGFGRCPACNSDKLRKI